MNAFRKTDSVSESLLSLNTQFDALQMCSLLINAWPGDHKVLAINPGGTQRANSCSVQSVMKKMRAIYQEDSWDYLHLNFWIKMQAFNDYLAQEKETSSQFITDSLYKISTLASKMKRQGILSEQMFLTWEGVYQKAQSRLQAIQSQEEIQLLDAALKLQNMDETEVEIVTQKSCLTNDGLEKPHNAFVYSHCFLGEQPDLAQVFPLSEPFIASGYDEMAYRLNFLRALPDFDAFDSTDSNSSLG